MTITHDRYFLDEVAGWILELDRGAGIPYEGSNYSGWLEQKQKRMNKKVKQKMPALNHYHANWIKVRSAPKGAKQNQKHVLPLMKNCLNKGQQAKVETAKIVIPAGPRLGDKGA